MAEVRDESTHVWSIKPRTTFFFAAMRHFAEELRLKLVDVDYQKIGTHDSASLADALKAAVKRHHPQKIVMVEPGDWRVEQALRTFATESDTTGKAGGLIC